MDLGDFLAVEGRINVVLPDQLLAPLPSIPRIVGATGGYLIKECLSNKIIIVQYP